MFMRKVILLTLLLVTVNIYSDYSLDTNSDGIVDIWVEENPEEGYVVSTDTNFDGKIDSILTMNEMKISIYEETDYNLDGVMDNFYFYQDGYVVRQEVDSNYDNNIDVWVYVTNNGKSIERYEKDLDFDGVVDKVKEFEVVEVEELDG